MDAAVYGPCTLVHGRVHDCIHGRVYTAVYTGPYTWQCMYTARVHGRVHGPYTAASMVQECQRYKTNVYKHTNESIIKYH